MRPPYPLPHLTGPSVPHSDVVVSCPVCGTNFKASAEHLGRPARCRHCGASFTLSSTEQQSVFGNPPTQDNGHYAQATPARAVPVIPPPPPPGVQRPILAAPVAAPGSLHSAVVPPPPGDEPVPSSFGRFQIRGRLGAGGFGEVYKAFDPVLERDVALKVPHAAVLANEKARARFLVEPKAAAQLRHPNIVPIFDAGMDGDAVYIAYAYIEGHTLEDYIERNPRDFRRAAEIVSQLAEAAAYSHRTFIVHRDIKPSNIMIDGQGQALLMDFGLAHFADSEVKMTRDGTVLGTAAYMAPEQADPRFGKIGPASDQYSLGVVLFELLAGLRPFDGPPQVVLYKVCREPMPRPKSINPDIPRDLETICLKALARHPGDRYETCDELGADLRRWLEDEPIHAATLPLAERFVRWCKKNPLLAALSMAAAFLVVLIAGLTSAGYYRESNLRSQAQSANTELARQREIAVQERDAAVKAKEQEAAALEEAKLRREEAERLAKEAAENFQMAREAVDKFFTAVSEDESLKAKGLEQLRKSLLETAQDFYNRLLEQQKEDPVLRTERARLLLRLSLIRDELGQKAEAIRACEAAIGVFQQLVSEGATVHNKDLALAYQRLGAIHWSRGEVDAARGAQKTSLQVAARLGEGDDEANDLFAAQGAAFHQLAIVLWGTGRFEEAVETCQKAVDRWEQLEPDAEMLDHIHEKATAYCTLGMLFLSVARQEDAQTALSKAEHIWTRLTTQSDDPRFWLGLAKAKNSLAFFDRSSKSIPTAYVRLEEATKILTRLALEHEAVPEYAFELANTTLNLAAACESNGDFDEAQDQYESAASEYATLADAFPDIPVYSFRLAQVQALLGRLESSRHRSQRAIHLLGKAARRMERLATAHPEIHEYALGIATTSCDLADTLRRDGDLLSAIRWYDRSIDRSGREFSGPLTNQFGELLSPLQLRAAGSFPLFDLLSLPLPGLGAQSVGPLSGSAFAPIRAEQLLEDLSLALGGRSAELRKRNAKDVLLRAYVGRGHAWGSLGFPIETWSDAIDATLLHNGDVSIDAELEFWEQSIRALIAHLPHIPMKSGSRRRPATGILDLIVLMFSASDIDREATIHAVLKLYVTEKGQQLVLKNLALRLDRCGIPLSGADRLRVFDVLLYRASTHAGRQWRDLADFVMSNVSIPSAPAFSFRITSFEVAKFYRRVLFEIAAKERLSSAMATPPLRRVILLRSLLETFPDSAAAVAVSQEVSRLNAERQRHAGQLLNQAKAHITALQEAEAEQTLRQLAEQYPEQVNVRKEARPFVDEIEAKRLLAGISDRDEPVAIEQLRSLVARYPETEAGAMASKRLENFRLAAAELEARQQQLRMAAARAAAREIADVIRAGDLTAAESLLLSLKSAYPEQTAVLREAERLIVEQRAEALYGSINANLASGLDSGRRLAEKQYRALLRKYPNSDSGRRAIAKLHSLFPNVTVP